MTALSALAQRLFFRPSIRTRAIYLFLITLAPILLTSTIMSFNTQAVQETANSLFETNAYFDRMKTILADSSSALGRYLTTTDSDELRTYLQAATELRDLGEDIPRRYASTEGLVRRKNILSMTGQYLVIGDAAVAARRGRFVDRYTEFYDQALRIDSLINDLIDELNQHELEENIDRYLHFSEAFAEQQLWGSLLIACSAFMSIILISLTSLQLSRPIMTLAAGANEIAKGNFGIPDFEIRSSREVEQLAATYNTMKASLKDYIAQIQEKGEIEKGLIEQKLDNMRMQHVLRIAEIQALQAQINPHFLFNTLNTGVQLAVVEGAERTVGFLEHLSEVYRYNIRHINRACSLQEELAVLDSYIYVVKIRFADRFSFEREVDPATMDIVIPSMILQPLVENAIVHGLKEMDTGGLVRICARNLAADSPRLRNIGIEGSAVELVISDNGRGMEAELAGEITKEDLMEYGYDQQSTEAPGIGVRNVVQRLHLFYGYEDLVDISSSPGSGTALTLVLPREVQSDGYGSRRPG